jgi:hypothetical protein
LKKYVNDILGGLVVIIGLLAIFGWFFRDPTLVSIKEGWITMKPLTACSLIIAGVHCISRSVLYRTKCRGTMLSALGLSYACSVLLFMWEISFLVVQSFYTNKVPFLGARDMNTMVPSTLTAFALFMYSLTGFCTKYSWSVASFLIAIGLESFIAYTLELFHVGCSYVCCFQMLSMNSAVAFVVLGAAIFVNRSQRTHWFVTECKEVLKSFKM